MRLRVKFRYVEQLRRRQYFYFKMLTTCRYLNGIFIIQIKKKGITNIKQNPKEFTLM